MKNSTLYNLCKFLFFLFALLLFCCTPVKVSHPVLLQANSLMECCPDSALLLLQGIEQPQKMGKTDRAFYALLLTKAEDKNYVTHTTDSLIRTAFDYYSQHGTTRQKMEVWYYMASVYRDLGDAPRAIDCFQEAIEVSESDTELKLLSQTYGQMGTLFFYQRLPEEGVNAYKKSYELAVLANDSSRLANSSIMMARVYTQLDNVDSTLFYYEKAADIAQQLGNKRLEEIAQTALAGIYVQLNRFEEARHLLVGIKKSEVDCLIWGKLYEESGKADSSRYSYLKALAPENLYVTRAANEGLYRLAKSCNKEKDALFYLEQSLVYKDSIQKITDTEGVKRVESLYAYQHVINENNRLLLINKHREKVILWITIVFLATVLLVSYGLKKMKEQRERLSRLNHSEKQEYQKKIIEYYKEIYSLKQQLSLLSEENKNEQELMANRLKRAVEEKNKIVEMRREAEAAFRISTIYQYIHNAGKNAKSEMKDEHWVELQKEIDKAYNDFTTRLYLLYPGLKQNELRVCLLVKARVANSDIATLLCLGANSVSTIRTRLFEKIHNRKGRTKDFDDFILKL